MKSRNYYIVSVLSSLVLGMLVLCTAGTPILADASGVVGGWYAAPVGTCCDQLPSGTEPCPDGGPAGYEQCDPPGGELLVVALGDEGRLAIYSTAPCEPSSWPGSYLCGNVHDSWCNTQP